MKKILLTFVIAVLSTVCASAMNLKEAFNALSNLPNITVTAPDYNLPVIGDFVQNGQLAAAYNLDREKIKQSGDAVYTILNQIPLVYMINGGNNNKAAAFVYSTPNDSGSNDILIVVMSGLKGSVVAMYGTVDNICRDAIQNGALEIQGDFLKLEATPVPDVGDFNITISKGR